MPHRQLPEHFHLHLVSDSTGETLEAVEKAALAQFADVGVSKHYWFMIRTARQMERVMADIEEKPGLIMYTLVNPEIRDVVKQRSKEKNLPTISVLDPVIDGLRRFLGVEAHGKPGQQHIMDADYFERINALHYTLAHDDGQSSEGLPDAQIVLVGVSRTSKTPTSIYLANRGFRTANIPYVEGCPLPPQLGQIPDTFIIGLTTTPDRLVQIRSNRLRSLKEEPNTDYVDLSLVKQEVAACRRLCTENGWPVIDVTRRSIEETAAAIINHYHQHREAKGLK